MGQFRQERTTTLVPGSVAARLEDFRQFEFDSQGSPSDGGEIYHSIVAPVAAAAHANPGVVRELAAIARPVGGWTVYGGHWLVGELMGYECRDEDYLGMLDDALDISVRRTASRRHPAARSTETLSRTLRARAFLAGPACSWNVHGGSFPIR